MRAEGAVPLGRLPDLLPASPPVVLGSVLEIRGDIPDPIAVTLIPGDQAMATDDLRDFSPRRFGDMLRQQLRRPRVSRAETIWSAVAA